METELEGGLSTGLPFPVRFVSFSLSTPSFLGLRFLFLLLCSLQSFLLCPSVFCFLLSFWASMCTFAPSHHCMSAFTSCLRPLVLVPLLHLASSKTLSSPPRLAFVLRCVVALMRRGSMDVVLRQTEDLRTRIASPPLSPHSIITLSFHALIPHHTTHSRARDTQCVCVWHFQFASDLRRASLRHILDPSAQGLRRGIAFCVRGS